MLLKKVSSRAGIKTVTKQNAIMRLKEQCEKWQQLCKNKTRSSDRRRKRKIFAEALGYWGSGCDSDDLKK